MQNFGKMDPMSYAPRVYYVNKLSGRNCQKNSFLMSKESFSMENGCDIFYFLMGSFE